ncbi:MAG TPA: peptide chain release factor-like protein [Kiritimatiellia bacterium]|nr:peptide chain release factor-like protein [Kiritimatiellia bacterium]
MAIYPVSPEKSDALFSRMARLGIREDDIEETFIRGSGSGGQKINKTSSCVQLLHKPTGIEVKCQRDRSQAMNRFLARRELCERMEEKVEGIKAARQQEQEKIRRQKRRRSRRQKARMLDDKKKHGEKKAMRRKSFDG